MLHLRSAIARVAAYETRLETFYFTDKFADHLAHAHALCLICFYQKDEVPREEHSHPSDIARRFARVDISKELSCVFSDWFHESEPDKDDWCQPYVVPSELKPIEYYAFLYGVLGYLTRVGRPRLAMWDAAYEYVKLELKRVGEQMHEARLDLLRAQQEAIQITRSELDRHVSSTRDIQNLILSYVTDKVRVQGG